MVLRTRPRETYRPVHFHNRSRLRLSSYKRHSLTLMDCTADLASIFFIKPLLTLLSTGILSTQSHTHTSSACQHISWCLVRALTDEVLSGGIRSFHDSQLPPHTPPHRVRIPHLVTIRRREHASVYLSKEITQFEEEGKPSTQHLQPELFLITTDALILPHVVVE